MREKQHPQKCTTPPIPFLASLPFTHIPTTPGLRLRVPTSDQPHDQTRVPLVQDPQSGYWSSISLAGLSRIVVEISTVYLQPSLSLLSPRQHVPSPLYLYAHGRLHSQPSHSVAGLIGTAKKNPVYCLLFTVRELAVDIHTKNSFPSAIRRRGGLTFTPRRACSDFFRTP
jgi:hypothetical protein